MLEIFKGLKRRLDREWKWAHNGINKKKEERINNNKDIRFVAMKFRKLTIENYKSFQFPTTIQFPDSTEGKCIFLIGGMNGAGKTSVMEGVNICLYGAKPDFIYKFINRKELAKGNAFVSFELILETDDCEEIQIKRSW